MISLLILFTANLVLINFYTVGTLLLLLLLLEILTGFNVSFLINKVNSSSSSSFIGNIF